MKFVSYKLILVEFRWGRFLTSILSANTKPQHKNYAESTQTHPSTHYFTYTERQTKL